jgi:CHAT domain-containing protein
MFAGLLSGGDRREIAAAVRLHDDVFSGALRDLPPTVTRLILVPDGPLHHLPFDALRASADAEPLAVRYELVVSPSATVWLDTHRRETSIGRARVLVLADPATAVMPGIGRLPYARRESRALARYLGDVDALVGMAASEHAIKTRALGDYELVHFAAHAVADETRPNESAVFLAPGDAGEDGLLQAHEISALDFDGRIVVLSACQTAAGAVLGGEGMLSLARAFFQAGARAVVGTRWRIRDEDAASLFDTFYRALGNGATLSAALAQTKSEAIARGRSPEVWAGLVLLGDGASRPFPPRPPKPGPRRASMALLALSATIALAIGTLALKRPRHCITRRSVQRVD